jgi:hypothetical protein
MSPSSSGKTPSRRPSAVVHEPIGHTVRMLRRQIWFSLAANVIMLAGLAWLSYYSAVTLQTWRQTGRDIQIENQKLLQALLSRKP